MVVFDLKFLLGFLIKPKELTEKKKGVTLKTTKKELRSSSIKIEDPPNLIRLSKQSNFVHIEYELIPGKGKYQFDVLCWEQAAKIFFLDSTKMFKTINKNGLIYAPVCLRHVIKELSTEDLARLQSSVIEFDIFIDKNKLTNAAKADKTEVLYVREIDRDHEGFIELYSNDEPSVHTRSSFNKSNIKLPQQNLASLTFDEGFQEILLDIIEARTNQTAPSHLNFRNFVPPSTLPKSTDGLKPKKKAKEGKGGGKPKAEKAVTKMTLSANGEIFFTDPNSVIYSLEQYKASVSKIYVVMSVRELLSRSQKIFFNPLVVKINKITNFPIEIFNNTGYTDVYFKYRIPEIADCKSTEKPIGDTITFQEGHIYFTNNIAKIKLLEFLESKRFIVEIYLVRRYHSPELCPKLFGDKYTDRCLSKITANNTKVTDNDTDDLLLGYCSYDLSSLLKNIWDYRNISQLHTLQNTNFRHFNVDGKVGNDVNSLNLAYINKELTRIGGRFVKDWLLMEMSTCLSLEAFLLAPQAASLVLHQIPNTFKRLLIIIFDKELIKDSFTKILIHNKKCSMDNNILTGFVIDNGNNAMIYVEGIATGFILNFWNDISNYNSIQAKIFFNTDQAYESRLYEISSSQFGLHVVIMKIPLQHIFKEKMVYIKGNMPLLCSKALTRLYLLLHSRTLKSMLQYDLLPSVDELRALDIEYGVPLCNIYKT
ncbi:hypothetical protein GWI33_016627 [Rhynchophorus ferrugineus]|uniref:DUF4550 domain-containing protein n=1 Tax=Rhynchophorus ferrugineus TaxID=354439 RepID=A0A834I0K4_RHYFE|nr:hypothetical protein GWI33_016627 [Rhynchophorus ferrugineus]